MDISRETWGFQPTDSHRSTRYLRGENRSPEWTPMPLWPRSCCKSSLGALVQWPGLDWYFLGISSTYIYIYIWYYKYYIYMVYIYIYMIYIYIHTWYKRSQFKTFSWRAQSRLSWLHTTAGQRRPLINAFHAEVLWVCTGARWYGWAFFGTDGRCSLSTKRPQNLVSTNNFRRPKMLYGHGSKLSSPKMDRWIQEMTSLFRGSILGRLVTADPRLEVPKPAQVRSPRRPPRLDETWVVWNPQIWHKNTKALQWSTFLGQSQADVRRADDLCFSVSGM